MGNCEVFGDRYLMLFYNLVSWLNLLKYIVDIVEYGNFFDQRFNFFFESQMGGVLFYVVIFIICVFELYNESMCYVIFV